MCAEASAQSYGEEGEEVIDNGAPGVALSERGSDELAARAQRMPSRRSSELGKRERRKRRMDDADEDDLNSLDEPIEGKKKRRGGAKCSRHMAVMPSLLLSWSRLAVKAALPAMLQLTQRECPSSAATFYAIVWLLLCKCAMGSCLTCPSSGHVVLLSSGGSTMRVSLRLQARR